MQESKIEWTDETWNPVSGCTKVSPGCKNCYAEAISKRFWKDRAFTDVVCHPERLKQPTKIKEPKRIFVNSMSDLFHPKVSFDFVDRVMEIICTAKHHTYQILTKRPDRAKKYFDLLNKNAFVPDNVWLGVSVEDQRRADERMPILVNTPAKIHFLSVEPMLEPIDLQLDGRNFGIEKNHEYVDWVIVGGESGPRRRQFNPDWARSIRDQCKRAGVPFFMKQVDKKIPIPNDLMIREFPI